MTLMSCVAVVSHTTDAHACGGCFHGSDEATPSVVTGHRMALAISPTRTVLWDQVQYAGDPADFAWVLPVGDGAYIEEADDAFFEALEAVTATRVMSTVITCNDMAISQQESSGAGCGSNRALSPAFDSAPSDGMQQGTVRGVTVEHEGTVGPYETATIKSIDPQALRTWLTTNGYSVPADIDPVIDAYVTEGASFIALRLKPGVGVQQMTPVRVITPGASPIMPLRMVAAGTGAAVSIVLYVIGEGRYGAVDRPAAEIGPDDLTWDWAMARSDYAEKRDAALEGGAFLTSFAVPNAVTARIGTPDGLLAQYDVIEPSGQITTHENLAELYFAQSAAKDGLADECGPVAKALDTMDPTVEVAAPCNGDPNCSPPEGSVPSTLLACNGYSDIAAALIGMHPRDVWITRLEANLPRTALETDLTVGAESVQASVSNWMVAASNVNEPACASDVQPQPEPATDDDPYYRDSACGCRTPSARRVDPMMGGVSMLGLLLLARRVSKRRRT
jgi:hypothetical protein